MLSIEYEFEDLPLITDGAFEAGEVNGAAEIEAHKDGSFSVTAIWLDGSRRLTAQERRLKTANGTIAPFFERRRLKVDPDSQAWLWSAIERALERDRHREFVESKISKAVEWAA